MMSIMNRFKTVRGDFVVVIFMQGTQRQGYCDTSGGIGHSAMSTSKCWSVTTSSKIKLFWTYLWKQQQAFGLQVGSGLMIKLKKKKN